MYIIYLFTAELWISTLKLFRSFLIASQLFLIPFQSCYLHPLELVIWSKRINIPVLAKWIYIYQRVYIRYQKFTPTYVCYLLVSSPHFLHLREAGALTLFWEVLFNAIIIIYLASINASKRWVPQVEGLASPPTRLLQFLTTSWWLICFY